MKHLAGYIAVGILLAAVAFAAYLWVSDYAEESDEPETERPVLKYSVEFKFFEDGWIYEVNFRAPTSGGVRVYLGDQWALDGHGEGVYRNFGPDEQVKVSYWNDYDGMSPEYIKSIFKVVFSGDFDAVRV